MNFHLINGFAMEILLPPATEKMTRKPSLDLISNSLKEIRRSLPKRLFGQFASVYYHKRENSSLCPVNANPIMLCSISKPKKHYTKVLQ